MKRSKFEIWEEVATAILGVGVLYLFCIFWLCL